MGDPLAFRALFDAHAGPLRRYVERIVRSREAAEDLVQDVFLRLWRVWERVDVGPGVRAYLYVTARSRALNHLRQERREVPGGLAMVHGESGEEPAIAPEAERNVEAEEIARAIERVLKRMPPRQREVAALRLGRQLSTAAIAAKLGISPRTVEVHVARATKALREQLPVLLALDAPSRGRPDGE